MTDDDELRARLRRADPAASLEPASPDQVTNLVEEAMSRTVRRWALPVAAALVLIAGGAAWAVTRPSPGPDTAVTTTARTPVTVDLTASGAQAKCRDPEARILADSADFAFEGTVLGIEGGRVTLSVSRVYKGTAATDVRVAQADGSSEQMLGSGRFETAKSYLIAAADGAVLICGYSGEADAIGLRGLYDEAF